jgi:hypothetical protein
MVRHDAFCYFALLSKKGEEHGPSQIRIPMKKFAQSFVFRVLIVLLFSILIVGFFSRFAYHPFEILMTPGFETGGPGLILVISAPVAIFLLSSTLLVLWWIFLRLWQRKKGPDSK